MFKYILNCFQEIKYAIAMYKKNGTIPYRYTEE